MTDFDISMSPKYAVSRFIFDADNGGGLVPCVEIQRIMINREFDVLVGLSK